MAMNSLGLGFMLTAEDNASDAFRSAAQSLDKVSDEGEKAREKLKEVGDALKEAGTKMMAMGGAGLAGLGLAANAAADYGKEVGLVTTIADEAEFPINRIKDMGYEFAQSYGGDAIGQIKALYNAIGSGAETAAEGTELLTYANKLAVAGASTTDAAMAGLTGTINAYGLKMTDAKKVSDAFFAAVKVGAADMTVDVLAKQLSGVSPVASLAGVSIDEMLASIARITSVGTNTSVAVTQLKAVIEGIMKPSTDATAEAKRLGISFDQATLKSKGLMGVLDSVAKSANYNAESFKKLFSSSEAFAGVSTLMGDGGGKLHDMLGELQGASGATDEAFKKMSETAAFAGAQLKASLGVAVIRVGEIIMPFIGKLMSGLSTLVNAFNNMPEPMQRLIVLGFAAASAALVLGGAVLVAAGTILSLVAAGEAALIAAGAAIGVFQVLGAAAILVGSAFGVMREAYERDLGGFATFMNNLWTKSQLAYDGLKQLFTTGGLSGAVLTELNKVENQGLFDFVKTLYLYGTRIANFFTQAGAEVSRGVGTMGPIFEEIKGYINDIMVAFGLVAPGADEAAEGFDAFGEAGATVGSIVTTAIEFIAAAVKEVVAFISGMTVGFRKAIGDGTVLKNAWAAIGSTVEMLAAAFAGLTGNMGGASSGAQGFGATLGAVIASTVNLIATGINVATSVFSFFAGILGGVGTIISGVFSVFGGLINIVGGLIRGDLTQAWLGMKQVAVGVLTAIIGLLFGVVSAVFAAIDGVGKLFGKNFGLQKTIEGMKGETLVAINKQFGLDQKTELTPPPPPPQENKQAPPRPGEVAPAAPTVPIFGPAGPAPGPFPAAAAAGASGAAAGGAADLAAAIRAQPPPVLQATITAQATINDAVLAEAVHRVDSANNGRSFGATPTSNG